MADDIIMDKSLEKDKGKDIDAGVIVINRQKTANITQIDSKVTNAKNKSK